MHAGHGAPILAQQTNGGGCGNCTVCDCQDEAPAKPADQPAATITIGQANNALAPMKIDAAGLIALGFEKQHRAGPASHFLLSDWPSICDALSRNALEAKSATF